jgi:hypothetical protein
MSSPCPFQPSGPSLLQRGRGTWHGSHLPQRPCFSTRRHSSHSDGRRPGGQGRNGSVCAISQRDSSAKPVGQQPGSKRGEGDWQKSDAIRSQLGMLSGIQDMITLVQPDVYYLRSQVARLRAIGECRPQRSAGGCFLGPKTSASGSHAPLLMVITARTGVR